ncbi:MAG: branched-chain amino acid ABC transporter permease [Deferrisomatales bacterium]|nr:branched-chain amino acid ABC transporter permease [Deferrisomatales bacterium]
MVSLRRSIVMLSALTLLVGLPFLLPFPALGSEMLIWGIFAAGYDILFGYTGLLSFGHAIFFGIGAYAAGLILKGPAQSAILGLAAGCSLSLALALAIGFLTIRRRGIYFIMATLAFCQMVYFIGFKWTSLTGGDSGLHGVPRPSAFGLDLDNEVVFYYFVLAVFGASMWAALRIVRSPFGRVVEALRENEDRARSVGYNTDSFKIVAFGVSAIFASLAGGVYAIHLNFVPLETLSIFTSGDVVIMTLVGGVGTLYGPVLGAMLVVLLKNLLSAWIEHWNLILSLVFMASVLGFRRGLFPALVQRLWGAR